MFDAITAADETPAHEGGRRAGGVIALPASPHGAVAPAAMAALYQRVRSLLPADGPSVVQFVGPQGGEGTSTVARGFAWAATTQQAGVLLLDGRLLAGRGSGGRPVRLERLGPDTVEVAVEAGLPVGTLRHVPRDLAAFGRQLRERFAMVVIDTPGGVGTSAALALAPHASGVVLVVEAERTRRPVVEHALRRIADAGGRTLGVVLNRRRLHIPAWLYRRL
jgi:Mrp family chromosome partitioning ATPase